VREPGALYDGVSKLAENTRAKRKKKERKQGNIPWTASLCTGSG